MAIRRSPSIEGQTSPVSVVQDRLILPIRARVLPNYGRCGLSPRLTYCAVDKPPRAPPHPVHPDNPGHPASDAIAIKVLTDLFSLLRRRSIDIKVFQTFSRCDCGLISLILFILFILCILLQTPERWRGTGPRPRGGSPAPVGQKHRLLPIRARVLPNYGRRG